MPSRRASCHPRWCLPLPCARQDTRRETKCSIAPRKTDIFSRSVTASAVPRAIYRPAAAVPVVLIALALTLSGSFRLGSAHAAQAGRGFVSCSTPPTASDGGGFGNLEPLLVRRVSCSVGLKVAAKRQCAADRTCRAAGIRWTCTYKSIAVETVRGWCRAREERQVRWTAGGAE